jgi:hypothetical protein
MSKLKSLVTGYSPRNLGFSPREIHMGFVVDNVALREISHVSAPFCHPGWCDRTACNLGTKGLGLIR